jgi:hypothetical protein
MYKDGKGVISVVVGNTEIVRVGNEEGGINLKSGTVHAMELCANKLREVADRMVDEARIKSKKAPS